MVGKIIDKGRWAMGNGQWANPPLSPFERGRAKVNS